jgi:AraC-like DNA-binding protein
MHLVDSYFMASAFARSLPAFCDSLNIDLNHAAAKTGVDISKFNSDQEGISLTRFANLLELLSRQAGDDCFGLKFGQFFKMGDSGAFGFCLMHAPNLEAIVRNYERFIPLTADYNSFGVNYGHASVEISWNYSPVIPDVGQYTDMMAKLTIRILRIVTGSGWKPTRLCLAHSLPKSSSLHRQLLCKEIEFGTGLNRITFPSSNLALPNPSADDRMFTIMKERCEEMLERRNSKGPMLTTVKQEILKRLPTGTCQLSDIATSMSLSERGLQRRLLQKGTTFEMLVEETRMELTKALIILTDISLGEVAEKVGYSNLAAFSRASKSWFGMPPSQMRRTQSSLR